MTQKKRSKFKPRKYARPPSQRRDGIVLRHRTPSAPVSKSGETQRDAVIAMARDGLVEDQIALRLQIHKNELRAQHIDDIKEGKAAAAAADAEAVKITPEEFHFLDAAVSSFASGWNDPVYGNMLFPGMDGKGAKDIDDCFRRWKCDGGKYILTGLTTRLDPQKSAEFSKIVSRWRQSQKEEY